MFKLLQKALLLSLFAFSSCIFPSALGIRRVAQVAVARTLNQSAAFRHSLVARCMTFCPGFQAMEKVVENAAEDEAIVEAEKSEVINVTEDEVLAMNRPDMISGTMDSHHLVIDEQKIVYVAIKDEIYGVTVDPTTGEKYICCCLNAENHSLSEFDKDHAMNLVRGVMDLQGAFAGSEHQIQDHSDKLQERIDNQNQQAKQHMSQIAYNARLEAALEAISREEKLKISADIEKLSIEVQGVKFKPSCLSDSLKNYDSCSNYELQKLKGKYAQDLFQREKELNSLMDRNYKIAGFINAEKNTSNYQDCESIRSDIKKTMSFQDLYELKQALLLQVEIQKLKTDLKAIDSKIQETAHAFENQLKTESSHEIEKTITTLVVKKAEGNDFAIQKGHELQYRNKQLHDVNDELKSFNNSWVGAKLWRRFSGNEIQKILVEKQQDLVAKIEGIKEGLRLCNAQLQDIETKITQAQNVFFEKQIAEQEAWLAQEKQAQETLSSYNQLIENQHEACTFDLANCPDPGLEKQWNERQDALFQTIDQGYLQYDQAFNLTPETCGFLAAHGIDYKNFQNFYGTALQQQLHQEMCDILSQAGLLQTEFGHSSNLVNSIVDVADAAYDANKSGQVLLASQLIDVDCGLFKLSHEISAAAMSYAQAAVSAVAHGTLDILHIPVDVFHIVAHPSETCKALGKTIGYVLQTAMLNDREILLANPEMFEPLRDQRNAEVAAELKNLGDKIADSSGPEIFEALLRFGTVAVVPEKILSPIGGVCGAVKAEVNIARAAKLAAAAGEQVGAEKLAHEVAQAAQKMEQVAQESIAKSLAAELMEAKKLALLNSDHFIVEFKKIGGVISVENKIFKNQFQTVLKQLEQKLKDPMLEQVKKVYGRSIVNNKEILIDLDHICHFELGLKKSNEAGGYILDIGGGHLSGVCEALEKEGLIKIISKHELSGNGIHYVMENASTGKPILKTVFPEKWTIDKVAQAVLDVYQNDSAISICGNGNFTKSGIVDGCELKIYWESSNNNGKIIEKIVTCLPIKK